MPLFRFHRGDLHESLKTTIIVNTFTDMVKAIVMSFDEDMIASQNWGASFKVEPYPDKYNFDERTGWYTQLVTSNIYGKDKMHPVGFLSEPFPEFYKLDDYNDAYR